MSGGMFKISKHLAKIVGSDTILRPQALKKVYILYYWTQQMFLNLECNVIFYSRFGNILKLISYKIQII
jgi:hypothetical protein